MDKTKSGKENENIARRIAKEETFVPVGETRKDINAIFIEDNPEKALEKLLNLASNENFQEKLQYMKHLAELLDVIGDPGVSKLKEIVSFILHDRDDIKRAFLAQIPPLLLVLQKEGENRYQEIVNVIVPIVSKLLDSNNYEIKEDCGQQLVKIGEVLNEEDRGKHLLTNILGLAHDDNEEKRMIAVRLLSQMAPLFGKDLCEQFVGFEFLSMGEDSQVRVRKEAVSNLTSIGKIVSPNFFKQRLLPFYLKLCKDSNWGVRKSCIDIIFEISKLCKDELAEVRENELTDAILNFLKDSNKWVKISAYKNLGPFISTLEGLKVNEKLIENYLHMADSNVNNLAPDNEIIFACSYNFPAVVLTLGPSKWPTLVKLFQTLVKGNEKIRKPIACSLHEIAKIIGEEKAEKDLVGVLERFLHDSNDDVKYGAIQNLAFFLKVFRMDKRENMVDIFLELQRDQKKWRIRELIARQIDKLTLIFPPEITFRIIAPISFKLCSDSVAFVREEASRKIHAVLKAVYNSEEIYKISVIENIKGFSQDKRFTNRQAFAAMCEKLMKSSEIFKENFMEFLIPLANDKVPNVRIALAKTLQKAFLKKRPICNDPQLIQLVEKLKNDPSKDVKMLIQRIEIVSKTDNNKSEEKITYSTEPTENSQSIQQKENGISEINAQENPVDLPNTKTDSSDQSEEIISQNDSNQIESGEDQKSNEIIQNKQENNDAEPLNQPEVLEKEENIADNKENNDNSESLNSEKQAENIESSS